MKPFTDVKDFSANALRGFSVEMRAFVERESRNAETRLEIESPIPIF